MKLRELWQHPAAMYAKIAALEFTSSLIIVAATRVYVEGGYSKIAVYEIAFMAQWFWSRNLGFEEKARTWLKAFPTYCIGAVLGAWAGYWFTK